MTSALCAGEKNGRGRYGGKMSDLRNAATGYADMEQGSGLRPIINLAMHAHVLRCTLYVDRSRCITEHKRSAGLGESSNDCIIVIDVKRTPHF